MKCGVERNECKRSSEAGESEVGKFILFSHESGGGGKYKLLWGGDERYAFCDSNNGMPAWAIISEWRAVRDEVKAQYLSYRGLSNAACGMKPHWHVTETKMSRDHAKPATKHILTVLGSKILIVGEKENIKSA